MTLLTMSRPEAEKDTQLRLGIDLGGTKIAAIVLNQEGEVFAKRRIPAPHGSYRETIEAIGELVISLDQEVGKKSRIGIGMPGSISPVSGCVQNANSTWLNAKPFKQDVEEWLQRPVRMANDANCFALSEAVDGAGAGAISVFGVILGTGCGGGLSVNEKILDGPHGISGEWGHNPLPWPNADENPGPGCWCGRRGCMETWVSGPGLSADHKRSCGQNHTAEEIAAQALKGNAEARRTLDRHASRLARGLAMVVNIIDPETIVLGGGLSMMDHLYIELPNLMQPHLLCEAEALRIKPPLHGPESGVRGAAWLWGRPESGLAAAR